MDVDNESLPLQHKKGRLYLYHVFFMSKGGIQASAVSKSKIGNGRTNGSQLRRLLSQLELFSCYLVVF